jgi:hypothetical protein
MTSVMVKSIVGVGVASVASVAAGQVLGRLGSPPPDRATRTTGQKVGAMLALAILGSTAGGAFGAVLALAPHIHSPTLPTRSMLPAYLVGGAMSGALLAVSAMHARLNDR